MTPRSSSMFVGLFCIAFGATHAHHCFAAILYDSVTSGSGLSFYSHALPFGSGIAFVDLDNDFDLDVYLTNGFDSPNQLFRNDGGLQFTEIPDAWGTQSWEESRSAVFADIDNDGDKDLFLSNWLEQNRLFLNDAPNGFIDISLSSGILDGNAYASCGVSFADVNGDGFLDIFVANRGWTSNEPNQLYINNGDLTFDERGTEFGVDSEKVSFQGVFTDFDGDGDQDLFVSSDRLTRNELYRNEGGVYFTDISEEAGVDIQINGMGVAISDVNEDWIPDFFVTNTADGHVFSVSDDAEHWTERAPDFGLEAFVPGWGACFYDADCDMDEDLFIAHGAGELWEDWTPNAMYENNGPALPFTDVSESSGVDDNNPSFGMAAGDLDDDGDIDVLASNFKAECALYENVSTDLGHWLQVVPIGILSNRDAIGTKVEVTTGGKLQWREIRAGSSYLSQMAGRAHFGLGENTSIQFLTLRWPSGLIEQYFGVSADQILVLVEGDGIPASTPEITDHPGRGLVAFPNPFRGTVELSLAIPASGSMQLRVLDVSGRSLATQHLGRHESGPVTVHWDGRIDPSRRVAAGTYWLELRSPDFVSRTRVVAVR